MLFQNQDQVSSCKQCSYLSNKANNGEDVSWCRRGSTEFAKMLVKNVEVIDQQCPYRFLL